MGAWLCDNSKEFFSLLGVLFWNDPIRSADLGKQNVSTEIHLMEIKDSRSSCPLALVTSPPRGTQGLCNTPQIPRALWVTAVVAVLLVYCGWKSEIGFDVSEIPSFTSLRKTHCKMLALPLISNFQWSDCWYSSANSSCYSKKESMTPVIRI